ncbi:Ankyrin repeat domain-containing protein [Sulfidibacter corallicola]|uniref:Ankyrin repeat domain-containing protein n=1 Tax=Sulfidibacter corallicola TaxID=2818388 RepID=A0A8A4TMY8_SULCO|nr:ankyrin repeat domain-containing protein [Sulfidibacter corallicola]QTD50574.1 ankyrin repeat domain-containing protein [Sulfidibacter corallicola]
MAKERMHRGEVRILVMDQSNVYSRILNTCLGKLGYPPENASYVHDSEELYIMLTRNIFDLLIFVGAHSAPEDPLDIVREIRSRAYERQLPILLISDASEQRRVMEAIQSGVSGYLIKPINIKILETHIRDVLELEPAKRERIGDFLLKKKLIRRDQLDLALKFQTSYCEGMTYAHMALVLDYIKMKDLVTMTEFFQFENDRFLDVCRSWSMLDDEEIGHLESLNKKFTLRVGDLLVIMGAIRREVLESALNDHWEPQFEHDPPSSKELIRAVEGGDVTRVTNLIGEGFDPKVRLPNGTTTLMIAAGKGNCVMCRMLLSHGIPIDARNNDLWTALSYAVYNGHRDVVRLLLEAGADVNENDRWGRSVFDLATERNFLPVLRLLNHYRP